MQKEIKFEKGKLLIGYCDNPQDISVYESGELIDPIELRFFTNVEMKENECLDYANKNMSKIIEEAKIIVSENNEFYKHFEIDFNSEFTSRSLYRHHLNRNLEIVSEISMRPKCKLKKNEL
jgi:hypothetical protein